MNINKFNRYSMEKTNTSYQLKKHFKSLGVPVKNINHYRMIKTPFSRAFFYSSDPSSLGYLARRISGDKYLQKHFLRKQGISVSKSELFQSGEKEQAKKFSEKLTSTVVKPLFGNQAKGVSMGVEGDSEFDKAWNEAINVSRHKKVLVEENFQNGVLARYLVVDGKCISVVEFTKPFITGNGKDTIEKLIENKNELRILNPHLKDGLLAINDHTQKNIKAQGYDVKSIPDEGVVVVLDHKANPNVGSDTVDITDDVHPLFKKIAEDATKAIPGLYVSGIDLLAHDHTIKPQKDNYNVIEINNKAGLGAHIYPLQGYPRNVLKTIANHLLTLIKIDNLSNHMERLPYSNAVNLNEQTKEFSLDVLKKPNEYGQIINSTNELLSIEFEKSGYKGYSIRDLFVIPIDDELMIFEGTRSSNFSYFANQIVDHNYWTRKFLKEDDLSVPEGRIFSINSKIDALEYAKKYNMQVHIEYRNKNIVVSSKESFESAWNELTIAYKKHKLKKGLKKKGLLVTRFNSDEIKSRYLIIDGRCTGVIQYITSSNGDLETINVTDYVHPNFKDIAEKAAKIVIGLDIVGVDIISTNHFSDPKKIGYGITGIKSKPSIQEFHYPTYGEPQNIAKSIVDYSVHWSKRKKYFAKLLGSVKEPEIITDKLLNKKIYRVRYIIKGKVKNRGIRKWIKKQALMLELDGFCRFRWNGTLEVVASSTNEVNLIKFKNSLEFGPRNSQVEKVIIKKRRATVKTGFKIR